MIFNLKTETWNDCYYRKVGKSEVGEYVPPRWVFDFKKEFDDNFQVFTMETKEYPGIAQGIVALKVDKNEYTVQLKSAETSNDNKFYIRGLKRNGVNKDRIYKGIGINLVAFACQYSLENDCDGHVNLISKSETIDFYVEELGGSQFSKNSQLIFFEEPVGQRLAKEYFPGGAIQWLN